MSVLFLSKTTEWCRSAERFIRTHVPQTVSFSAERDAPFLEADFRLGSFASVLPRTDDFWSTPINRHRYCTPGCLTCANTCCQSGQKKPGR